MPILFEGIDDRATVSGFQPSGAFTVAMWLNLDTQTSGGSIWRPIVTNCSIDGTGFLISAVRASATGLVYVLFDSDNGNISDTLGTFGINTWAHAALTWDGSNAYMYANGVQDTYTTAGGTDNVAEQDLYIGASPDLSISRFYKGMVDELAIYSVALSQSEINQLYNPRIKHMPLQIQNANLQAYWAMDDGAHGTSADGDSLIDLSGNNNNGVGNDGANNTGLTWQAEQVLSYQPYVIMPIIDTSVPAVVGSGPRVLNRPWMYPRRRIDNRWSRR